MIKSYDYIIVGLGIAGLTFCETLLKENKSFLVIDVPIMSSTRISAGIINPMVLKRFTPVWKADEHVSFAFDFYENLEKKLTLSFFNKMPMYRIFSSVQEQNEWVVASDKTALSSYLSPAIYKSINNVIKTPFGLGKINFTGIVNTQKLLRNYTAYLQTQNNLIEEKFDFNKFEIKSDYLSYKDIVAKNIIFSEGFLTRNNPYFKKELIIPNKGEFLVIRSEGLKLNAILKTSIFVVPLGNDLYKIGATYDREDKSLVPTQQARESLIKAFKKITNAPFTIISQTVGMRPTTLDRRPLIGNTPNARNIFFFSGLGTRGIMNAPSLAEKLYNYIENGILLEREIDIKRRF